MKHTIAFYNLENLFDLNNDGQTNDDNFLPISVKKWTYKRYTNKLRKLGFVISNIGLNETNKPPAIIGLAEIENDTVLNDLIGSKHLKECNYNFVHYDSLDERGIDVALLYDTTCFEVINSEAFPIHLVDENGTPDYTRDILLVTGLLEGEEIHVIVNHWSSRREGEKITEPKRMASSNKVIEVITHLQLEDPNAKIVVVGDFNDDPSSNSIKHLVKESNFYNSMDTLRSFNRGTTNYNRQWNLFDQIIFSINFFQNTPDKLAYDMTNIFDEDFLKLFNGKFKGTPFRTYIGKKYQGGYSDHFPVYAVFEK